MVYFSFSCVSIFSMTLEDLTSSAEHMGDSAAVGLLLSDHLRCFSLVGAPRIEPDGCRYRLRPDNPHRIRVYHSVDRTFILEDFFAKLRYYFGS